MDFGELHRPMLNIACREIGRQKGRLGGTFAVAHAVTSRKNREFCRDITISPKRRIHFPQDEISTVVYHDSFIRVQCP